jgi:hypothetical protein
MPSSVLAIILLVTPLVLTSSAVSALNITGWNRVLFIGAHPDDIEACSGGSYHSSEITLLFASNSVNMA